MEETMHNSGTGISHELSHTFISRFTSSVLAILVPHVPRHPSLFPSLTNNCSARRKENQREKDDEMKRREGE